MKKFNVIVKDINSKELIPYNVIFILLTKKIKLLRILSVPLQT